MTASKSHGRDQIANAMRFASGSPFSSTTFARTRRICCGSGMSTGQIVAHALQLTQRLWGPTAFSSPWCAAVFTRPMGPE